MNYNTRIIERKSHGKSGSSLIKTLGGIAITPPTVITCFGSFLLNSRPFVDFDYMDPETEDQLETKMYFTYSRNDGPVQRVVIDIQSVYDLANQNETEEDYSAVEAAFAKLDLDLCRGEDGVSMAFYLDSNLSGFSTHAIPPINNPWTANETEEMDGEVGVVMNASFVGELDSEEDVNPDYRYVLTGISGDGLFPINDMYNQDAREVAIPVPASMVDEPMWNINPDRWYPINIIEPETNTITVYPSEYTDLKAFDLFEVLGGVDNTPLVVTSCSVAKPRQYICNSNVAIGALVSGGGEAVRAAAVEFNPEMNLSEMSFELVDEPMYADSNPFPFEPYPRNWGGFNDWPDMSGDGFNGSVFICQISKNGGPIKEINWNHSPYDKNHHGVWDAIKEILLDDYGRTAFMLHSFNASIPPYIYHKRIALGGLSSNATLDYQEPVDGPVSADNYTIGARPYMYDGNTVEVRDEVIKFTKKNVGFKWNENNITIYKVPYEVRRQYGEVNTVDFYELLCKTTAQYEEGLPITIHSCGVVEPEDHIQVNTKAELAMSSVFMSEALQPLTITYRINNDDMIQVSIPVAELDSKLMQVLIDISFMGVEPLVSSTSNESESDMDVAVNKMYFRVDLERLPDVLELSGCSGTERGGEFYLPFISDGYSIESDDDLSKTIVNIDSGDTPDAIITRESNSVTFIRNPIAGHIDLYEHIKYTVGNEYTMYSSASIPTIITSGGLVGPVQPDMPA